MTLIWGSRLSCRMQKKNYSVLFAERYWPVKGWNQRSLSSSPLQFVNKPGSFCSWKVNDLKRQVSTISQFMQLPPRALLTCYQVGHIIAKCLTLLLRNQYCLLQSNL